MAKLHIAAAHDRWKAYDTNKANGKPIFVPTVGQEVLLSTRNLRLKADGSKKLMPKWGDPLRSCRW